MIIISRKKIFLLFVILGVIALGSFDAFAGSKSSSEVYVSSTSILGSFGSARNSVDNTQAIHITDHGTSISIWARNASGTYKTCVTNDPARMAALRGASSTSYFVIEHSGGVCTALSVTKGSQTPPKNP